jgi:DNA-binding CsgD family transcriptional regulator
MGTATGLHYRTAHKYDLSPRQRDVLDLVARGYTNAQIGDALGMTLDGAKFHVSEIMGKLGFSSREEAAHWWHEYNRPAARVYRILAPLTSWGLWRVAGTAAAVAAAGAIAVVAIIALQSGDESADPVVESAAVEVPSLPFTPGAFRAQQGTVDWELDLRADGTFNLSAGTAAIFAGSYTITNDQLVIDDGAFGSVCEPEAEPGSYQWTRTADTLVLTSVDEPCDTRGRIWARTWRSR